MMIRQFNRAIEPEWWVCECGNEPDQEGFVPCDENGVEVEPTLEQWRSVSVQLPPLEG